MSISFPNESSAYRAARDRLLAQEIDLRRQMEAVAAARRALPAGGVVATDYVFEALDATGRRGPVKLSDLFGQGKRSVVIYSMMFPRDPEDRRPGAATGKTSLLPLYEAPCPSCTALLDPLNGAALHVAPHIEFVVAAKAPLERILAFAAERGWRHHRMLSSAKTTYNHDYHGETTSGAQRPMMNVFHRDGDVIRHFWGSEMLYAETDPGQDPRHLGTLEPAWNMFDLTREGRGANWDEQLQYEDASQRRE
jgi:predicted dithiol-disulfide oxidoreductase (DUF899 family)